MQEFNPTQYLKIALANAYGLDKETWDFRIGWYNSNRDRKDLLVHTAEEPLTYQKTLNAIEDAVKGIPTGYYMMLDATASSLQILACLSGCHITAFNVNLIDPDNRYDAYTVGSKSMSELLGYTMDRSVVKHPIMTSFFGSKAQPRDLFGEGTPELEAFYEMLQKEFAGAWEVMNDIQSCWNPTAKAHVWTLPDGHTASVKVMVECDKKIEIDELNHCSFTHRAYINEPSESGISLVANITHSIDGYIVREMTRRCRQQKINILHVHDAFGASPIHMNQVRKHYRDILAEIAESNLLSDILTEICGYDVQFTKFSNNLADYIRNSNYALS